MHAQILWDVTNPVRILQNVKDTQVPSPYEGLVLLEMEKSSTAVTFNNHPEKRKKDSTTVYVTEQQQRRFRPEVTNIILISI